MLETGIPNLDLILGGGIPEGDTLLVVGSAGTGKTTLVLQTAFHVAASGHNALYISTLSETPARIMEHFRHVSFFDQRLVGRHLFMLSVYPLIAKDLTKAGDAIVQAAKEHQAKLVVIDGLQSVRDLHPAEIEMRTFIYELGAALTTYNATTVVTSSWTETAGLQPPPEFTVADGILELGRKAVGTRVVRTIMSNKMRGLRNLLGEHSLCIDDSGISVFPRIESIFEPCDIALNPERMPFGLLELDRMMSGGPLASSVTTLAGAAGTGKTTSCLQFIMEGARQGQQSLFLGFRETPHQLIDKARNLGMDLEGAIAGGRAIVQHRSPVDLVVDEATWHLYSEIKRLAPQRLALDSIDELEYLLPEERRRGYMAALAGFLRNAGVSSLIVKEIPQVVGPELDFSDTPLAVLAESLILMRYVEFRGDLFRILSVLKMRDSDHDHSIRQYTITGKGIRVLEKLETAEGVLTGIARLPSEMRVKRTKQP